MKRLFLKRFQFMLLRVIQLTYDTGLLSYIRQGQNHFDGIQFVLGHIGMHGLADLFESSVWQNFIFGPATACIYWLTQYVSQQFKHFQRGLAFDAILLFTVYRCNVETKSDIISFSKNRNKIQLVNSVIEDFP